MGAPSSTSTFEVGAVIAETYTIEAALGRGGMGMVYRAGHRRLPGKRVAIKVLHAHVSSDETLARFKREAEIASLLGHPNIAHIEDYNVTPDGTPYLVLEYLDGESLAQRLAQGPLALEQALSIVRQVGSALAMAHAKGIVHRDLKPQNIFLVRSELEGRPVELAKVLDFGISKMIDSQTVQTDDNALLGTPQYMAPEQASGQHRAIDVRTDVFALGAIVHEMLSGQPAFLGTSIAEIVFKVVYEEPAPLPAHVPATIAAAVRRAMSKEPAERFASVGGFVEALTGERLSTPTARADPKAGDAAFAQTVGSGPLREPVAVTPTIPTVARRRPIGLVVAIAVAVAALAVTAYLVLRGSPSSHLDPEAMQAIATQLLDGTQVELGGRAFRITHTSRNLRNVKFDLDGHRYEAIEQNPERTSRWAELARGGHRVVQFKDLATNAYIGVVVDGKLERFDGSLDP